ncbi:hypothetical protein SAMN04489712_13322 [Thermomonospora echinospora]|uniref:Magnesium transporter NIPA n=1 Tax=Thermomonospora echinospora TaxID=1992 RepID=A0A1H6E534_9ACTN|nr:DMT family transporter [Thermomonospora echinospora]SEG92343.1 hypothetical protein SAMN04489712_13322 [Thermomonospora echinospora]
MIAVLLALVASLCNATASVLQRRGTLAVPEGAGPLLFARTLLRRPVWLAGIAALIGGFVLQAAALGFGGLSLVEPLLVMELPFTMLIIALFFRARLSAQTWLATVAMTAGLAGLLVAAAPGAGISAPATADWVLAALGVACAIAAMLVAAWLVRGSRRTVLLGAATGVGFAFTAALMKGSTGILKSDPVQALTSWQPYAMVATGLFSLMLLQVTLHSGTLVAAQPPLTIIDPVASIILGALLFDEPIRAGPWIALELVGVGLIVYGAIEISRTPAFHGAAVPLAE